jgi:hypothetical protein
MGIASAACGKKRDEVKNSCHCLGDGEGRWRQSVSIRKIAEAIEYSVPVIYDHLKTRKLY